MSAMSQTSVPTSPGETLISAECEYVSPCGPLWLAANRHGLVFLRPMAAGPACHIDATDAAAVAVLQQACEQLTQYFAGILKQFSLPLSPQGTGFQQQVWRQLQQIPYGASCSYGSLAKQLDKPGAARAVGSANGANQIAIIIPCHRVVGHDGRLTGYAWGLPMKQYLLALEQTYR